jgi:arylsulfatase A-like enzyme
MNYFEASARVPLLVYHPRDFFPHRVSQNVSTLDILPTMCDLVGTKPFAGLPMDGMSLWPHLKGMAGHDTALAEYTGEGTISPLMMIRRGPWKFVICPADGCQLFNLADDPLELRDWVKTLDSKRQLLPEEEKVRAKLRAFELEALERWNFKDITQAVLHSQRKRRLVWAALKKGRFASWDYNPSDDGREK